MLVTFYNWFWQSAQFVLIFSLATSLMGVTQVQAASPTYKVETNVSEIVLPMGETVDVWSILKYADTGKEVGLAANITSVYWEIDTAEIIDYKRRSCDANPVPCFTNEIVVSGYQLGTMKLTALVMMDGGGLQIKSPPIKITVVPAGQTKVVTPFKAPASYPQLINYSTATPSSSLDMIQMLYAEYPDDQDPDKLNTDIYLRGKVGVSRLSNVVVIPLSVYFNQDSNPLEVAAIPVEQDPWQFLDTQYELGFTPAGQVAALAAQPQIFNQFNADAMERYLLHTQGELSPFQREFINKNSSQGTQFLVMVFLKDALVSGQWTPTVRVPGQRIGSQLQIPFNWLRDDVENENYTVQYQLGIMTSDPFLAHEGRFFAKNSQAVYAVKDQVFPKKIFGFTTIPYLSEHYVRIRPNDTHFLLLQSAALEPKVAKPVPLRASFSTVASESAQPQAMLKPGFAYKPKWVLQNVLADNQFILKFLPLLGSLRQPRQDSSQGYYLTQQPYDPLVITSSQPVPISVLLRSSDGKTVVDQSEFTYEWTVGNQSIISITGEDQISLSEPCCSSERILPYPYVAAVVQAHGLGKSFYTVVVRNKKTGEELVKTRFPVEVKNP